MHAAYILVDKAQHILFVATATILKDRQLLIDYGAGYWMNRTKPEELE